MSSATGSETPTPLPDLVWRVKISGLLLDLTAEVKALTEIVMEMNERPTRSEGSPSRSDTQEVQCEKCGSEDVLVSWHRRTPNGAFQTECERNRSVLDRRPKSKDEHLHYHCRRCQYDWIGSVLAAREKVKS